MTRNHDPAPPPTGPSHGLDADRMHRFLRYSHIFSSAVREIMEARYLSEVSPDPLSLPQFHLLKLITLNGKHQVGEIAGFLGVSPPAASKNVDKLERLDLVTRSPSKGDRRATLLSASRKGRRLVERYEVLKERRLTPVLRKFRGEEIDEMARLMERFAVQLFREEGSEDEFCLRCAAYVQEGCPLGHVIGKCTYEKIRSRSRTQEIATET